jgi:hypothetical protein
MEQDSNSKENEIEGRYQRTRTHDGNGPCPNCSLFQVVYDEHIGSAWCESDVIKQVEDGGSYTRDRILCSWEKNIGGGLSRDKVEAALLSL